ncbi:MAG: transporter substrate-binding domain-containing protein [Alcaligenaceae bacterium]|nr:transporter substrate-binding domain-containing protein [Alcaligenaceae bacterium]
MWRRLTALLLLGWLSGISFVVSAACPVPADDTDVAVGIRLAPPFITQDSIRGRQGFALELWQSIAHDLQQKGVIGKTEMIECSLHEQMEALASGDLDVVISPLTITAERMALFDFSHQYMGSGITLAQQSSNVIDFGYAARIVFNTVTQPGVPRAILVFMVLNLVLAGLVSRVLKAHKDFEVIDREPRVMRWFRAGIETIIRTTGLQSTSSDFRSTVAKLLDVVMAIIGTLLSAIIFGVLTAALIGSIGVRHDVPLGQLPQLRIATLSNSTSQAFLEQFSRGQLNEGDDLVFAGPENKNGVVIGRRWISMTAAGNARPVAGSTVAEDRVGITCQPAELADKQSRCITTSSWFEAMQMLAAGEVDAVLGDWAQLSYLARLPIFGSGLFVQSSAFRNEPYGWGINQERPDLRDAINQALLDRIRNPQWRFMVQEYMGSGSIGSN